MKNYLQEASTNLRLEEGPRVIEQLLLECYLNSGISTKELARKTLLPVPVATAIKKELIKVGVLQQDRGVRCTLEGNNYIKHRWGYDGLDKMLYLKLMNNNADWEFELADILSILTSLFQSRPQVNVQIDQSACTVETSLRRAILCLKNHSLIGKRILCVGDDDLVSISLGFLLKRLFPKGSCRKAIIDVLDIDQRFLSYINDIAVREGLPINCHHVDLRQPLPRELHSQYDCFYTDPPYTIQGMTLFISRGISALKKEKGLSIFFSFAHKSPDFMLAMHRELVRMGLMVKEIIPLFNKYEGAEMIGNRGQMIILKTTEQTSPGLTTFFDDALYTGEIKRTQRIYRCKQCKQSVLVGFGGDFTTIEELKNKGCSRCHYTMFALIDKKTLQ